MYDRLGYLSGILCVAALVLMLVARVSGNLGLCLWGILLFGTMMLVISLADYLRRKENEKNPITTVEAAVVGHRMETYQGRYSTSHSFYVSFMPAAGGDVLEFKVSEAEYRDFCVGEKGKLRYRTWEYLSFKQKDLSAIEPLPPLPDEYEVLPDTVKAEDGWERAERLLDALIDKGKAFLETAQAKLKAIKTPPKKEEVPDDDGILTHELDD